MCNKNKIKNTSKILAKCQKKYISLQQKGETMETKNIETTFVGLKVPSPIISGSCGLTSNIANLVEMEKAGVGAIVLKSLFEEQITYDIQKNTGFLSQMEYGASYDYIANHVEGHELEKYYSLIREAQKVLSIPIVASINCATFSNWVSYAKKLQDAGCDALELNFMMLPFNVETSVDDVERVFDDTITAIKRSITIPIIIKVGKYFTDMAKFMSKLSWAGINGITMFNKTIDFDIDTASEKIKPASIVSAPQSLYETLRWVALLSGKLRCEISASSGIFTGDDVVKALLAGARTVQVVSSLYNNGISQIKDMNTYLKQWMDEKGYRSIDDFRGKMAVNGTDNSAFVRTQFMKYYAEIQ